MRWPWQKEIERSSYPLGLEEFASYFTYLTHSYPVLGYGSEFREKVEQIEQNFLGYTRGAYAGNGVAFACILSRLQIFSQVRFKMRNLGNMNLFGSPELLPLEVPEPGKTTSDLLARMEIDVSLAGNSFHVRRGNRIKRLRPDWVTIVLGGDDEYGIDLEVAGYAYFPGGPHSGRDPIPLARDEVAHYAPVPDPTASYRGMSWLTPVIREIMADSGWREHKIKFLEQGGIPPVFYKVDPGSMTTEQFNTFVEKYRTAYEGQDNAYKALFMRAAVDPTVLGANFQQMDYKKVQGASETRIAAAAGVPPIVVGLSEGLEAATYSNYGQARRRFADGTVRWLWENAAGALQTLIRVGRGNELWYDERFVSALQEDRKDEGEIIQAQSQAAKTLIDGGFEPDAAVEAVTSSDLGKLRGRHTGLNSVQLQPPGTGEPSSNGTKPQTGVPVAEERDDG